MLQIFVPTNPRGAERLPPNIIVSESDLYPRRLIGWPIEVCGIVSFKLMKPFQFAYIVEPETAWVLQD